MPPSQYLQLGYKPWGETDFRLTMALAAHEASLCGCGCGYPADVAHSDDTEGRWQVEVPVCYARAALDEFTEEHREDLDSGSLLSVRLLPEGETPTDPFTFSPDGARVEYERHQARLADRAKN